MAKDFEFESAVTQVVETGTQVGPIIKKVGVVFVLWGTSYTLQDIASIISIFAGSIGAIYSLCLLTKFWWDNFWKHVFNKLRGK